MVDAPMTHYVGQKRTAGKSKKITDRMKKRRAKKQRSKKQNKKK